MTIQHYVICNSVIHAQYELPEDIIPGLPPKIYEILHHALNKDINERYQSCGEMVAEIENCLYDMNYRPNTKILEQYITSLFEKEHSNEKNRPIEILKCTADEEKTEPEIQIDDKLYQKTRVINQRNEADAKNIKIKKGVIDYWKIIVSGNKKWIILISVLILLTFFGALFIKSKETKKAQQPELSIDFIKKLPKIIVDDINKSMKSGKKSSLPEKEPGR